VAPLIGPLVALAGVLAAAYLLRSRVRHRRSLYAAVRAERERRVRAARERTLALAGGETPGGGTPLPWSQPWDSSPLRPPPAASAPAPPPAAGQESGEEEPEPALPRPRLAVRILSYAGLLLALLVVVLGVVLMLAFSR
jgi:hypothetical protein